MSFLGLSTGWLKTPEMYSLTVLEARSPKSKRPQGPMPSEMLCETRPCFLLASGSGGQSWAFLSL